MYYIYTYIHVISYESYVSSTLIDAPGLSRLDLAYGRQCPRHKSAHTLVKQNIGSAQLVRRAMRFETSAGCKLPFGDVPTSGYRPSTSISRATNSVPQLAAVVNLLS